METTTGDEVHEADLKLFQGTLFNPPETAFRRCPERAIIAWRIQDAVTNLQITAALTFAVWLIAVLWQKQPLWWLATPLALTFPVGVWNFIRARLRWRMRGYYLGPQELWVRSGIGTRFIETSPYGRIQECTVATSFWGRRFDLATVSVSIGAQGSLVMLHIEPEEAEKVAKLLRDLALKRGVQL